eukprot:TRINITY_DN39256_c0_g1_i1.p1 TRINITY_DN39256_c0_g1~~TRINITY_DN39256_c0_g1_i1.p1  ORF type:complete len:699 (-),score=132.77 TRINITY_DN39256_c0_g1_i1:34-2130(-)
MIRRESSSDSRLPPGRSLIFDPTCAEEPITAKEIAALLELELETGCPVSCDEGGSGRGWVLTLEQEGLRLETWMPGDGDTQEYLFMRSVLQLPDTPPELATNLLFDLALRKQWDSRLESFELLSSAEGGCEEVVHVRTRSSFGLLPASDAVHRRLIQRPCGDAAAVWLSRDAGEGTQPETDIEESGWVDGLCGWVGLGSSFRLRGAVVGHVVRNYSALSGEGSSVFTYLQMKATPAAIMMSRFVPDIVQGLCGEYVAACKEHLALSRQEVVTSEFRRPSVTEFYDLSARDEELFTERGSVVSCDMAAETEDRQAMACDFLGAASCSRLVPAASAFRRKNRSKRSSVKPQQQQTAPLESYRPSAGEGSVGAATTPTTPCVAEGGRRRRSTLLRERSRERQRGSMESMAQRMGAAVKLRTQSNQTHGLEVVPEEGEDSSQKAGQASCSADNSEDVEPQAAATSSLEQVSLSDREEVEAVSRRRFTLPLPMRRRKVSASKPIMLGESTDSEDSISCAGCSESSGSSCQLAPSRRGSSTALEDVFRRARAAAARRQTGSCATSTTAASSRASSPCRDLPGGAEAQGFLQLKPGSPQDSSQSQTTKPTLAGAAWVLSQLCKKQVETPALEDGSHEELAEQVECTDEQEIVKWSSGGSLIPTQAFGFCFPEELCGVPLEPRSSAKQAGGWTRSSQRHGRRRTTT